MKYVEKHFYVYEAKNGLDRKELIKDYKHWVKGSKASVHKKLDIDKLRALTLEGHTYKYVISETDPDHFLAKSLVTVKGEANDKT